MHAFIAFLPRDADMHSAFLLRQRVSLSGWLGVCHSRCCIKRTTPIFKLFRPSGSAVIQAFVTPCTDTKFQGEPLHRECLIHGVRKIGDFQRILQFISETVRYRPHYGTLVSK